MRTSKEQTEYILARRDEKLRAIARRRTIIVRCSVSVAACFVVAIGVAFFAIAFRPANGAAPANHMDSYSYFRNYKVVDVNYSEYMANETKEAYVEGTSVDELNSITNHYEGMSPTGFNGFTNIAEESIEKSAVGELLSSEFELNDSVYSISRLRDLPTDISLYVENDSISGLLYCENNFIDFDEFNLVSMLNTTSGDEKSTSDIVVKLRDCLASGIGAKQTAAQYTKQITVNLSTENNLKLRIIVLLSPSGNVIIKLLPAENDVVIAYTTATVDSDKMKELIDLLN
ncbi:MAG: hypothetical protein K6F14_07600 [Clostridiales bacterium]|nr:hypothetical protein [Clostridiales bacterium]